MPIQTSSLSHIHDTQYRMKQSIVYEEFKLFAGSALVCKNKQAEGGRGRPPRSQGLIKRADKKSDKNNSALESYRDYAVKRYANVAEYKKTRWEQTVELHQSQSR